MPKRKQENGGGDSVERVESPTRTAAVEPRPSVLSGVPSAAAPPTDGGPRRVLADYNSVERLVESLRACKKVVVITGAGISVSCGIPDFRSENGVYEMASRLDLGLTCPEDLFDLEFFTDDPAPFFKFAKALYPGNYTPSLTHRFLKALESRKKLLRNFTQNIDGLEAQVGLKRYVACHGSFLTATCLSCKAKRKAEDIREEVMRQQVPRCPVCHGGVVKPDITFFGEKLSNAVKRAVEADNKKADLLMVLGTSLQVAPVSRILQFIPPHVPQVLINRDLVRPLKAVSDGFDLHLLGDCDRIIQYLCARLGWDLPEPAIPAFPPPPPPQPSASGDLISRPVKLPATFTGGRGAGLNDKQQQESNKDVLKEKAGGGSDTVGGAGAVGIGVAPASVSPPAFVAPNTYVFRSSGAGEGEGLTIGAVAEGGQKETEMAEVVTCDGCDRTIQGRVYACGQCFGFDLCDACHAGGQNHHSSETGHTFRHETLGH